MHALRAFYCHESGAAPGKIPGAAPFEMELHHAFFEDIMVAQKLFDHCAGNCF